MSPDQDGRCGRTVKGVEAETARQVLEPAAGLQVAAAAMVTTLGTLSDPSLSDGVRDVMTERLWGELRDTFQAAGDLAAGLRRPDAADVADDGVDVRIEVHPLRWRRHGWGRE
jgi:hypothetical protein